MNCHKEKIVNNIDKLLEIGIALSPEKKYGKVLEMILKQARRISGAEAGSLYLCENNRLVFKIMQNDAIENGNKSFREYNTLPSVPISRKNVAGYTVLSGKIINIPDVNKYNKFNFEGPKKYDRLTGYNTVSILVAPLKNSENRVIGVLQLINARNDNGEIIPFAADYEKVISSLASQAALSITNIWHIQQIENLLHSFVESMATAIDARTPYNARHTQRVAKMVKAIIDIINSLDRGRFKNEHFSQDRAEQLIMAAWLHDIGKIGTPLSVLNKSSKLGNQLQLIQQRFDYIMSRIREKYWKEKAEGKGNGEQPGKLEIAAEAKALITRINEADYFIKEKEKDRLKKIAELTYIDEHGDKRHWLTAAELQALTIKKGTLTRNEREMVENHVEIGIKILKSIPFPDKLKRVPEFVAMHHEFLDGSGYPGGLGGNELPLEARILTLVDIFDALVSHDRPYRSALSVKDSLKIIKSMVNEEKLDGDLFCIFQNYNAWKCVEKDDKDVY